ncbi:hypothetical protein HPP92_006507 [Vanilla planifolia]|uniref:Reverse transcriptase domain-containing protein n=1 Tax=Vanilla planifolia TaxID=51239 RepID=A0A835RIJ3_VANPL|nr:hypothetical protein HPP92_006507 [Vanilla planifolia]
MEFHRKGALEERWWWQQAKVQWAQLGDKNTQFFHAAATSRWLHNRILHMKNDKGELETTDEGISNIILNHFEAKWRHHSIISPLANFAPRATISYDQSSLLTQKVTQEKIIGAIRAIRKNKAPGINGITAGFMQGYCYITQNHIVHAIEFFVIKKMPMSWKDTLITLIPKKQGANEHNHFRPISLCNTIYKVVAHILVERLKAVLLTVISSEQGVFVPGRSISDNIFIAQEMATRMHSSASKQGMMAIKIDMEQAYDRVHWQFVDDMMRFLGFPREWRDWIMACISSPRFGILLNGTKLPWIQASCGLRQGCPLSPYIFTIVIERMSSLMHEYEVRTLLGFR